MDLTIIIPTRERQRQLANCLEAIACQDFPRAQFEVVVVDDGSRVSVEPVVAEFRARLTISLVAQPHQGPARARNAGAAHARAQFLAFTDDDCKPSPDWLRTIAARFESAPDCLLGGRTINALSDNLYSSASQMLITFLYAYYNRNPRAARFLASNNLAVSKGCFQAIGGFDTRYPRAAAEDREFCDRWRCAGKTLIYAPEVIVYHAHPLGWRTFWRQHFWYGRGAFAYHHARARRALRHIQIEPLPFYFDLLRFPFSQENRARVYFLAFLLLISQIANAAGFVYQSARQRVLPSK